MRYLLLLILPAALLAQPPTLSLRDAVVRALAAHPSLSALRAGEEAAQARVTQARAGYLPKVNYAESFTRSDNPVFVFSSLLTQRQFTQENFALGPLNRPDFLNNFQSQVAADQVLFDAGQTKRAVRQAELSLSGSREDTRRQRQILAALVVRAYLDLQLAGAQLEVARLAIRSAEADLARADARRQAGFATDADVLSVRVHLAAIQEQLAGREGERAIARATLNEALGMPLDSEHTLVTPLQALLPPASALADLEAEAGRSRPERAQAQLAREIAATQWTDSQSRYLPQVFARGVVEANRQNFVNRGAANWLLSVGLRWNLFNGGADKARIAETSYQLRRAEAIAQSVDAQVRLDVRRAWAQLQAAQDRIDAAQSAVSAAEESLRITQNRYEAGLATMSDLLRTESALLDTRSRRLAAIHHQRLAAVQLALATASLNQDSELLQ